MSIEKYLIFPGDSGFERHLRPIHLELLLDVNLLSLWPQYGQGELTPNCPFFALQGETLELIIYRR